jgi:hypothetical protein
VIQGEKVGDRENFANIGEALPKNVQNWLKKTFPKIKFDFSKGRFGVSKVDDGGALYTQVAKAAKDKIANPNYIYKPDLELLKYEKGYGTGKQLLEKAKSKGINITEGRSASIFADNFNIKSKKNPFGGQTDKIYDLTSLDNSKKIEKIIKGQVSAGKATEEMTEKYLSKDEKLAKKRKVQAKKIKAIKTFSDLGLEKKMKGTTKTNFSHMDDIYSQFTTGETVGYAPAKINKEFLESYDNKFKALYKKRDKLLKEKPKNLAQELEKINLKGARLAGETGGYKSFKFIDPYTLKPYQFGVDVTKTIDPLGILEGKTIKEIRNLSPEDRYYLEENRKNVLKAQKKVAPVKKIKELKAKIKQYAAQGRDTIQKFYNKLPGKTLRMAPGAAAAAADFAIFAGVLGTF